jgi:hypothetical protein
MKRISTKEAARMMGVAEQFVRVSIFAGKIPGAYKVEGRNGKRGQYYITDEQVKNLMKGVKDEG